MFWIFSPLGTLLFAKGFVSTAGKTPGHPQSFTEKKEGSPGYTEPREGARGAVQGQCLSMFGLGCELPGEMSGRKDHFASCFGAACLSVFT